MSYLVSHHGTYWFQIRVPAPLVSRYGRLIRQNLQTTDRSLAQPLAYQLASHWLARFTIERTGLSFPVAPIPSVQVEPEFLGAGVSGMHNQPKGASDREPLVADVGHENWLEISDSFDGLLRYWRKLHPECSPSTYREVESVVKGFKKAITKRPSELIRTDITAYRDKLIAKGLAHATVSKKISFVSTLLQTAFDAGVLPDNVARGLRIPKRKVEMVRRRAFSAEELKKIFSSPVFSKQQRYQAGGGEAAALVPLIALATGARLEEICQLKATDITLDSDHGPLMRISDECDDQRVKTTSSRRTIPLHPELVKAGLLDYWQEIKEANHEWLFPALEPDHDGRRGGNWGKWFARYLRSSRGCHILDPRVVFHSFRHTFKTLCREAGLSEEIHDALTGHKSPTVGRSYGHVPLPTLVEAVSRIRFPISLPRNEY